TIPDALWPADDEPSVTATVTGADQHDGLTVHAVAQNLGDVTGAYVALIEAGTESEVTAGGGFLGMQYVRGISGGAFEVELVAASAELDRTKEYEVIVWQQHTVPDSDTIHARGAVTITPEQWDLLQPRQPEEPKPEAPKPPAEPGVVPGETVPGGSLRWAISSSFSEYITGHIAQGA